MQEFKEHFYSLPLKSLSDLSLYSAGMEDCAPGYHFGPRYRPYQLIHFITRGTGTLSINDVDLRLHQGEAFIIPAGTVSYYEASRNDPWSYAWISFLGIRAEEYSHQLLNMANRPFVLEGLDTTHYAGIIRQILALRGNDTSRYFQSNGLLLQIIGGLFADFQQDAAMPHDSYLAEEIKYYLDTNYGEKIVLAGLARRFNIHPNYLTRIFRQSFGTTPKQYLIERKLQKACQLLISTSLNISTIANSLGFDDALAFSRCFKKKYALSPLAYRQEKRIP